MARDLRLQQQPSGKYDFVRTSTGGLEVTDDCAPALLRLLIQGVWLGDDGERAGESLPDITLDQGDLESRARLIIENRGAVLVRRGDLTSLEVTGVESDGGGGLRVSVLYAQPGQPPRPLAVQVRA